MSCTKEWVIKGESSSKSSKSVIDRLLDVRGITSEAVSYTHLDVYKRQVEASIDSIAKTVNTRYQEGFTTASKIAHSGKYCAKHAAASWLSDVNSYIGFFDKYYKDEN